MYADDLVIVSDNAEEIQRALITTSMWYEENEMNINAGKTEALKFRKTGALGKQKLYVNRIAIEFVHKFKY